MRNDKAPGSRAGRGAWQMVRGAVGMPVTARCLGSGGSEVGEATEGLFATSLQDDNEGTAVQGVIKSHCPITDNTPITSRCGDVQHNMRLAVLDTRFASGKGRIRYSTQL